MLTFDEVHFAVTVFSLQGLLQWFVTKVT